MNIRTIKPEDSRSYVLLKRETWLNTYVNLELGITKEAIENWYSNIEERVNKANIVGPIEDSVALPNGVVIPELEMIRSF